MRITAEMKKLPHFIMVLYLVIVPATQGKSITSREFPYTKMLQYYRIATGYSK